MNKEHATIEWSKEFLYNFFDIENLLKLRLAHIGNSLKHFKQSYDVNLYYEDDFTGEDTFEYYFEDDNVYISEGEEEYNYTASTVRAERFPIEFILNESAIEEHLNHWKSERIRINEANRLRQLKEKEGNYNHEYHLYLQLKEKYKDIEHE